MTGEGGEGERERGAGGGGSFWKKGGSGEGGVGPGISEMGRTFTIIWMTESLW